MNIIDREQYRPAAAPAANTANTAGAAGVAHQTAAGPTVRAAVPAAAPAAAAPRPTPGRRQSLTARPLQDEIGPEQGVTQASPSPSFTQVTPPIPPIPLFPNPYNEETDGLTMRDLLQECIGHYIIAEHQVGISNLITREGRLVRVEANAYVLEEQNNGDSMVCDYYSLKFFRCLAGGDR